MDNRSDPSISFQSDGTCNYCNQALAQAPRIYYPGPEGSRRLGHLLDEIKQANKSKPFDCLMGISGGLDSSYLAYLGAAKWGLRILALHIDDGFDTDVARKNIDGLVRAAGIQMVTIRPDPQQFNGLLRAYISAGVPNITAPQDNILFGELYRYLKRCGMRTFLSGGNFALESILQRGHSHSALDAVNIRAINDRFGRRSMDKLTLFSHFKRDTDVYLRRISSPRPLNYIDYQRAAAFRELREFSGFEYYGSKHLENVFTKFAQVFWLYTKFGVDKRTSHYSSMIVSDQMTRTRALELLQAPPYEPEEIQSDFLLLREKLEFSEEQWDRALKAPPRDHTDFRTSTYPRHTANAKKLLGR